jgi:zinc D-Ala-D-Ala carboxypeptidase
MRLSENFTLDELTKSQEAIRLGIPNEPSDEHITNLILLCKNILQPIRNHFKMPCIYFFRL